MARIFSSFHAEQPLVAQAALEVLELEPNLFVYRQVVSSKKSKKSTGSDDLRDTMALPTSCFSKMEHTGIVNQDGLQNLIRGRAPELLKLTVVTDRQRAMFQTHGWPDTVDELYKDYPKDPWAVFSSNEHLTADHLLQLDGTSHRVFDRHGQAVPVAVLFDYVSSGISESSYDLEALARHLRTRPDVLVYGNGNRDVATRTVARTIDQAIFSIPSYNAEKGRTRSVQFLWMPEVDDYQKVESERGANRKYHSIQQAVLKLDLLGSEAFLAGAAAKKKLKP